ncbi:MAG: hypothetical protein GY870_01365, partial [archaeon]|nr:hypothetical protein [archaeon]
MNFEHIVDESIFCEFEENPQKIFEEINFRSWIQTLRWIPKEKITQDGNFEFKITCFGKMSIESKVFFLCELKLNQRDFFLPIEYTSLSIKVNSSISLAGYFTLKAKKSENLIYFLQAEYDPDFWRELFIRAKKPKEGPEELQIDLNVFKQQSKNEISNIITSKDSSIETLGRGDTTNIVLKIKSQNTGLNEVVCKIYKTIANNPEISILNHLSSHNFVHIPQIYALMQINSKIQISFMESFTFGADSGSIFWNELTKNLLKFDEISNKQKDMTWNSYFQKIFPKSKEYGLKIGKTIYQLHTLLKSPSFDKNLNESLFSVESFTKSDVNELKNELQEKNLELFSKEKDEKKNNETSQFLTEFINNSMKFLDSHSYKLKKQRIHQDLHLGQMMVTDKITRDPIILDFEGDPL